jgi:hypothetical protein
MVIRQLEVGIPSGSLGLLDLPVPLTRGEYLSLINNGVNTASQLWDIDPKVLKPLIGSIALARLEELRPKAVTDI